MRVRPRQARALASVERILSAALDLVLRRGSLASVTVEQIAAEAYVTPQAVYRYFRDVDALIGTAIRCIAVRAHEHIIEALSSRLPADEREFAGMLVDQVLDARVGLSNCPACLRGKVLRAFCSTGIEASVQISEIACRAVDPRCSIDIDGMAIAYTALVAVAIYPGTTRAVVIRRGGEFEHVLVELVRVVLGDIDQAG